MIPHNLYMFKDMKEVHIAKRKKYRVVRNKFMVFISHQICGMLLLQPKWTKISPLLPIDSYT